jgi:hypothetical protein
LTTLLGAGAAGGQASELGELRVGGGQADLQPLDLAQPPVALGFSDAVTQVAADLDEAWRWAGSGRGSGQRKQLC